MSVKRRPTGMWRARYRDEDGKEHARHFATQKEARAWEAQKRSEVYRGDHLAPSVEGVTLEAYFRERYAPSRDWASKTRHTYALLLSYMPFRGRELGKIRRADVDAWVRDMRAAGLGRRTIRQRVNLAGAILEHATRARLIARNPAANIDLGKPPRAELSIPTPGQVRAMLDSAPSETVRTLLMCGALAGLRIGEARSLQARDLEGDLLQVRRQHVVVGGVAQVVRPKHGSARVVPIPEELAEALRAQAARVGATGDEWVFPGKSAGMPLSATGAMNAVRRNADRAGVPVELRHFHALRHFYASGLIAAGVDPVSVARALGHQSVTVTLDVYSHLWHTAEDRLRGAAVGLVEQVQGAGPQ